MPRHVPLRVLILLLALISLASLALSQNQGAFQSAINYSAGPPTVASHTGFFGGGILPLEAHTRDSMGRVLDFDGDGKADLAVAAACSAYEFSDCPQDGYAIVTYQGNGDGSFKPCPQNLQSSCAPPYGIISGGPATPLRSIAVGDFNGDGKMDVVTASDCLNNQDCSSGSMVILFGQWRRDREVDAAFGPRRGERGAMRQV